MPGMAWQKRFERERVARKEAESLLEEKSRALFLANEELRRARDELEERVAERTRELEWSRQEALRASRAKSEFLANMSHEIRTPMTAIQGFSELLAEQLEDPELAEFARIIHGNGGHLLSIINDILDLSKVEAGKIEVESVECDPIAIVAEVHALLVGRAKEKGIDLEFCYEGSMPAVVRTDPTRVKQILINLVGNAIKFTEVGTVRLVTRAAQEGDTDRLEFDVIDSGVGMEEDAAARVFAEFEQADTSITRRFGGTGLGLSISRRFAQLLGGDVSVVSTEPGIGSTFRATIATSDVGGRWIDDPREHGEKKSAPPPRTSHEGRLSGLRVLIADDSPINQKLFGYILEREGAEVTIRRDGRAAIDAFFTARERGEPVDLILMDMQMPVLDGYAATWELRDRGENLPVIALTAQAMQGDRERCLASGCTEYVTKPVEREELIEAILGVVAVG